MILPPFLEASPAGYAEMPELLECARRSCAVTPTYLLSDRVWSKWRPILDYVACVEMARQSIKKVTQGLALGSEDVVPAQYHSASLVFFAQAGLDNIALWACEHLGIGITGGDCAFHKPRFIKAAIAATPELADFFRTQDAYIRKLGMYRQEWIHRMAGGAQFFADAPPPEGIPQLMVPMDPRIHGTTADSIAEMERFRAANGGRWLYTIDEFASIMADGLRDFIAGFLAILLKDPKLPQNPPGIS